jgi:hypothetical protein
VSTDAFKLQVPLLHGSSGAAATAAARSALLSRAMMPPLRAVLAKQQLSAAYEAVHRPLLQALGAVRGCGIAVCVSDVQQELLLCEWQISALQQQVSQVLGQQQLQQQVQQQQTQPFSTQGYCGLSDSNIRLLLQQQRLVTVSSERLQLAPLTQLLQLAVRTAIKRKHTAPLQLLRLLLTLTLLRQHQQMLQQLLLHKTVSTEGSSMQAGSDTGPSSTGRVVLQPHAVLEPVTGQLNPGWPVGLEGVLGFRAVPALPVLTSAASLCQQGLRSLASPLTVAASVQPMLPPTQQQQQQQAQQQQLQEAFVMGKLVSVSMVAAEAHRYVSSSQLLPWQMPNGTDAAGVKAATGAGTHPGPPALTASTDPGLQQPKQQQQQGMTEPARSETVRMYCGVTERVRDLQAPTTACYSVINPARQQQGHSSSGGRLMLLPSSCSISHIVRPGQDLSSSRSRSDRGSSDCASSSSSTFIGVQLQCLALLVLAGVSQDKTLLAACTQNPDPLAAAAAAWLPSSGLPQQMQASLLWNIQAGVLDGVPVAAGEAPALLLSVALQSLVLGRKASVQREQLGVREWTQGTNLVDSLLQAFPGVAAWHDKLVQDAGRDR